MVAASGVANDLDFDFGVGGEEVLDGEDGLGGWD